MKARLKTILLSALGAIACFSTVTYTSCQPDKCKAISCAYGGACKDGACICQSGYEGTACETITREKYAGVWTVTQTGTKTEHSAFSVSFRYGLTMTDMIVSNFYNQQIDVAVKLSGDKITIPLQTVGKYEIQGNGVLDREAFYAKHGKIEMRYTIKDLDKGLTDDFGLNIGKPSLWQR